ncbi:MAG: SLBB domain-containing protein [Syntrophaceae bacterium]|nr:SLBB domain-containing protein [Deltaproteobacteria bacterium]
MIVTTRKIPWGLVVLLIIAMQVINPGMAAAQQVQVIPITPSAEVLSPAQSPASPASTLQPGVLQQTIIQQKEDKPAPAVQRKTSADQVSEFEQYVSGNAPASVSTNIRQFGYDLFSKPPSSFAPAEEVPVGPDYVVGPGDEIRVSIWGSIEGQWTSAVDRDGTISLPKVGTIGVTGLTFTELKETIHKELSKFYTGFQMNVSMGSLRTIRVYVVGNASSPGAYTISSLSTLLNALFEAGGPSKTGTMRDIRVERSGQTVVHFDLYDLLHRGDKTKDIRLMPEDVIFIPPVGALVGIAGSVHTPAIYELKGENRVSDLIDMAGGLSAVAFAGRVQIERIMDNRSQVVLDSDLEPLLTKDLSLQSGDLLKIFQVVQDRKMVRLTGAVNRGGEYGFTPGMTVRDLISMAGGLKHYAYVKEAELTRVTVTSSGPRTETLSVDLKSALEGDKGGNLPLKEDDYLFVRAVPEWQLYRTAQITGEVKFPGTFTIQRGERLSSLIERAGGYTDKAYLRGAVFTRVQVKELQQKGIEEMVTRLRRELLAESAGEVSTSSSAEELQAKKAELESKQKFIEALRDLKATGRMTIGLAHLRLLKGSEYDIELEEGDHLHIPTMSSSVNVMGSVMSLGSYVYSEKFSYKDYVAMSGGYTRYADTDNVYVLKVDGSARKLSHGLFNWNDPKSRWEVTTFGEDIREIEPGDSIIVPEKLDRVAWLREVKDITQILMQMAVTAGVVIKLF